MLALSLFEGFADIEHLSNVVSFNGKDMVEVEYVVRQIMYEWENRNANYTTSMKGYVLVLFNKIFREMRKNQLVPIVRHVNRVTPEIISYIEEHYSERISLTELARMSFYNPGHFSKIFKETFGKTLTEFVREKRIERAVELLKKDEMSVDDIVKHTGFCDKKQFYRIFKKATGITPGEFRRYGKK